MTTQLSLPRDRISVLLLEGISQTAVDYFSASGYTNLIHLPKALDDNELKRHIADAHIIGIRSRTQLTEEIFDAAKSSSPLVVSLSERTRLTSTPPGDAVSPYSTRPIPTRARSQNL